MKIRQLAKAAGASGHFSISSSQNKGGPRTPSGTPRKSRESPKKTKSKDGDINGADGGSPGAGKRKRGAGVTDAGNEEIGVEVKKEFGTAGLGNADFGSVNDNGHFFEKSPSKRMREMTYDTRNVDAEDGGYEGVFEEACEAVFGEGNGIEV